MPWSLKARVQHWLPGVEMTEVEVHMATYFWSTAGCPQAVQIWSRWWLRSFQVRAISINGTYNVRNAAYDFSVKLSSCICGHTDSSCPAWPLLAYVISTCACFVQWQISNLSQCAARSGLPNAMIIITLVNKNVRRHRSSTMYIWGILNIACWLLD